MFRVGQKVAFVDAASGPGLWLDNDKPVIGGVYTIGDMFVDNDGDLILILVEKKRGDRCFNFRGHRGYAAVRFRPIVERKTDISVFQEILRKATKKVGESARAVEQAKGGEG